MTPDGELLLLRNQLAIMRALLQLEPHGDLGSQIEVTEAVIEELEAYAKEE